MSASAGAARRTWPAPLIVMVAPNGARRTKADHPALPMTPGEIAETAAACRDAGACMIHMHVRDGAGQHTLDAGAYREATAAVRRAVGDGLIIQVTSEAVGLYTPDEQMAMVRALRPEAVSLALSELVPGPGDEARAAAFFGWLERERIAPQYILYSAADVTRFRELRRRGVIPGDSVFVLYVLGRYAEGRVAQPDDLAPFLDAAGTESWLWAVCAFGANEQACVMAAVEGGGHARVGFENNLLLADGRLAPDNAALVEQLSEAARSIARPLASANDARALLGLG